MGQKWESLDGKMPGVAKDLPSNEWGERGNLNAGAEPRWGCHMLFLFDCTIWPSRKGSSPVIWDNSASESRRTLHVESDV